MKDYRKQADDFAKKHGITLVIEGKENRKYFSEDEQPRDVYKLTLMRNEEEYNFEFGQSLIDSDHWKLHRFNNKKIGDEIKIFGFNNLFANETDAKRVTIKTNTGVKPVTKPVFYKGSKPEIYDVLASLTKTDPETFENFCSEYGYDEDSRKAYKVFLAVTKEYNAVINLFGDIIEELSEIQ